MIASVTNRLVALVAEIALPARFTVLMNCCLLEPQTAPRQRYRVGGAMSASCGISGKPKIRFIAGTLVGHGALVDAGRRRVAKTLRAEGHTPKMVKESIHE